MKDTQILIVELGSQYTSLIKGTLRRIGVESIILSPKEADDWFLLHRPKGIILSGGSASVYDTNAVLIPSRLLRHDVPILGICYGMQLIAQYLRGSVEYIQKQSEYGPTRITSADSNHPVLSVLREGNLVWASLSDTVTCLPQGFSEVATTIGIAAMADTRRKIWGVQFHPEVMHTDNGKDLLRRFVFDICGCDKDWSLDHAMKSVYKEIHSIDLTKRICVGISGGVDSFTLAALLSLEVSRFTRVEGITIDTGALRRDELDEILNHAKIIGLPLRIIPAAHIFQIALYELSDPIEKRQAFIKIYEQVFRRETEGSHIAQGSLAPDFIESGKTGGDLITSHHNVGLEGAHPFRDLFKFEVREIARKLNLPASIWERQPFPGPGLYVRVLGQPPTHERLEIVRWADYEISTILRNKGLYNKISQLVVAIFCIPVKTVKGDKGGYGDVICIHPVQTEDFMTAKGIPLPREVEMAITAKILQHPRIARCIFDYTSKPPATIEYE